MAFSAIKFAIIVCIMLATMDVINSQILSIGAGFDKTNSLLKNVNNTSITMKSILEQLTTTQVQMSQTDTNILNKLNDIGETQNQMTNTFNQVVTLLQMQSQQLEKLTELTANQLNVQNQILLQNLPHDCLHLASKGNYPSGVYRIKPSGLSNFTADVFCDMITEGGGWTIFQRRFNGEVDFYRNWTEYEQGFGDVVGEHWAGLHLLHLLTSGNVTLRVELSSFDDEEAYAEYDLFSIGDLSSKYTLTIGSYRGNAGDALEYHNNMQFTTKDRENDAHDRVNCAENCRGAWWYVDCFYSNLNGLYGSAGTRAMAWRQWKGLQSLKSSTMMLRHNQ